LKTPTEAIVSINSSGGVTSGGEEGLENFDVYGNPEDLIASITTLREVYTLPLLSSHPCILVKMMR
jgi:hypothetical protein